jgi:hypothetical protein
VYIVGGVIPRFADFFLHSGFAKSFADKGCMSDYFKGIPVWLVTAPYSGLPGLGWRSNRLLPCRSELAREERNETKHIRQTRQLDSRASSLLQIGHNNKEDPVSCRQIDSVGR